MIKMCCENSWMCFVILVGIALFTFIAMSILARKFRRGNMWGMGNISGRLGDFCLGEAGKVSGKYPDNLFSFNSNTFVIKHL